jgi:hypothetical protein
VTSFPGDTFLRKTIIALTDRARLQEARADRFFTLSNKTEETDG